MAEQEQSRSESATPYKLQEARRRGLVPKSLELNSLAAIGALLVVMAVWGRDVMNAQARLGADVLSQAHRLDFAAQPLARWLAETALRALQGLAPLLLALVAVAVLSNLLQTGPVFTTRPLEPDVDRINPVSGFRRLFGARLVFELFKNLVKLALVAFALWQLGGALVPALLALPGKAPSALLPLALGHAVDVVRALAVVLAAVALADVVHSRWSFFDRQKMSRREVREELKHREGDPRIRSRMRDLRRERLAQARAIRRVPQADVVITNPSHVAVALQYRSASMSAPVVLAKGRGELAERMKALARRHRVPIVENRTLARALFRGAEVDGHVPQSLFPAVARLLVWVYALRDARGARPEAAP